MKLFMSNRKIHKIDDFENGYNFFKPVHDLSV